MLQVHAQFTVFGHRFKEVDLTPALGGLFIFGVLCLIGANTFGG
jgi:hypothetical protein